MEPKTKVTVTVTRVGRKAGKRYVVVARDGETVFSASEVTTYSRARSLKRSLERTRVR